jgi:C-terminal processing protease CtpA/Prc
MIAWFADRPFRFASRYEVKASSQTRRVLQDLAVEEPGGVSAEMLDAMGQRENGETFEFEIPTVQPRRDSTFAGRIWVLVNRHSYSNATTVAAIIQDYGFGTVLGEETSDVPTSFASSAQFTLPETGIVVTYPKAYFVRPSGDEGPHGVVPDHLFHFPIVPAEEDSVLQEVLAYIGSRRP